MIQKIQQNPSPTHTVDKLKSLRLRFIWSCKSDCQPIFLEIIIIKDSHNNSQNKSWFCTELDCY